MPERIPRDLPDMVRSLHSQVQRLRDFAHRAFVNGEEGYGSEVASKLRLLATTNRRGDQKPLLLELIRRTSAPVVIVLGGPPLQRREGVPNAGDTITLERFMALDAVTTRGRSGDLLTLSKSEFVRAWAEQAGGAHEDWAFSEAWSAILARDFRFNGVRVHVLELQATTDAVLSAAAQFFKHYEGR
jgi:hypothetical protein